MQLAIDSQLDSSPDALFRAEFARRAAGAFSVRHAEAGDEAFLRELFVETYCEAARRAGADPALVMATPLMAMQFTSQRASYAHAHPHATHYIAARQGAADRPLGRLLLDWTVQGPVVGIDVAVLPSARRGGLGLHLLGSWVAVCDRLGRAARLQVMPDNPARDIYRKLGFVETDPQAFPVPMLRQPVTVGC